MCKSAIYETAAVIAHINNVHVKPQCYETAAVIAHIISIITIQTEPCTLAATQLLLFTSNEQ